MVADFGIALAVSEASGKRLTETGLSIGTPHYMSPEQAMGDRELDARSDVYSLGAMLYEMLAGEPPYQGSSAQAIVAKVITEKAPPVTAARDTVPAHINAAILKALNKMPADRFGTASAFADALTNVAFTTPSAGPVATESVAVEAKQPAWHRAIVPGLITALVILAAWGWFKPERLEVRRMDLSLGDIVVNSNVEISHDGTMLAVAGRRDGEQAIFVRRMGEADFHKVPGTEDGQSPSFSPDDEWIVFRDNAENILVRIGVSGGGALTLVPQETGNHFFPRWGEDGTIAFISNQGGGHQVVDASGGTPRPIGGGQPGSDVLPDGSGVLLTRDGSIHFTAFDPDSSIVVIPDGIHPTYLESGHLLYVASSGGLFAAPFDLGTHTVTGTPVRVLDRVAANIIQRGYAISRTGVLVHHEGAFGGAGTGGGAPTELVVATWDGDTDTLRLPSARRLRPRFSPDGQMVAYESRESGRSTQSDIYTFDLVTNTQTQITFDGINESPIWSPDGNSILYLFDGDSTDGEDLWVKAADNSSPAEEVLRLPANQWPLAWLDDDRIVFGSNQSGNADLFVYSLGGSGEPEPYLQAPWNEFDIAVSPDGTLAAHASNKTERQEVWIRDFPIPQGEWRVTTDGRGRSPRWAPDGRTLYFLRPGSGGPLDTLFAVPVDRTSGVVIRDHEPRFVANMQEWDLHPDGERFIAAVIPSAGGAPTADGSEEDRYLVVLNWFEELRERVGK